jgi:hypothetical protein
MRPLHLPAPGDGPGPRSPEPGDDQPLPADPLDDLSSLADLDALVDEAWADDAPDAEVLPPPEQRSIAALELEPVADEAGSEIDVVITQEAPLPARAADPVVVGWRSTIYVDGEPVPAVCDPMAARTTWTRPGGRGQAQARLRIAGVVVEAEVDLSDGRPAVRLGRDVLAGRFWIEVQ